MFACVWIAWFQIGERLIVQANCSRQILGYPIMSHVNYVFALSKNLVNNFQKYFSFPSWINLCQNQPQHMLYYKDVYSKYKCINTFLSLFK